MTARQAGWTDFCPLINKYDTTRYWQSLYKPDGLCLAIPGYFVIYFLRQKVIDYQSFLVRLESITLQQFSHKATG